MPPARSRSPREEEATEITPERLDILRDAYRRSREQRRGGVNHRRRLKGLCCGLLRFLIQLLSECIAYQPTRAQSTEQERVLYNRRRAFLRRRQEAEDTLWWVTERGWLPRRDQDLLGVAEYPEIDSELGEPIVISDEEEESNTFPVNNLQLVPYVGQNQSSASASSQPSVAPSVAAKAKATAKATLAKVKVRPDNRLLQELRQRASIDVQSLSDKGVVLSPSNHTQKLKGYIISLDWHQVCDRIRRPRNEGGDVLTEWNGPYYLLPILKNKLRDTIERVRSSIVQEQNYGQVGAVGIPIHIIVLSYTHSPKFRDKVLDLGLQEELLTLSVTTEQRVGVGGKLWTLKHICDRSARIIHVDDNCEILEEIREDWETPGARPLTHAAGISIPRKRKAQDVFYSRNVLEALSAVQFF